MFYDNEPALVPWDYFLTDYERDLLTLTFEEMVRRNPEKTTDELKGEMEKMITSQNVFKGKYCK